MQPTFSNKSFTIRITSPGRRKPLSAEAGYRQATRLGYGMLGVLIVDFGIARRRWDYWLIQIDRLIGALVLTSD